MKQMVISFLLILFLFDCLAIECNQLAREYYKEALPIAMEQGIYHALTSMAEEESEDIRTDEELYGAFLQELLVSLGEKAAIDVEIYDVNQREGILNLGVTVTYSLPFGGEEEVHLRKKGKLEIG